jgi:hypothetical protein
MRKLSGLLLALLWMGAWAQRVQEVPNPRPTGGWVTDMVGILTPQQKQQLNALIDALERDTGAEMAVVILQRTVGAEPKAFATELFNHWGIGKKGENNGILVLVALQQRRIEVETGYGIEGILPDSEIGMLLQDVVVPAFRRGDYGGGLITLVRELTQRIRDRSSGSYLPAHIPGYPNCPAPHRLHSDAHLGTYSGSRGTRLVSVERAHPTLPHLPPADAPAERKTRGRLSRPAPAAGGAVGQCGLSRLAMRPVPDDGDSAPFPVVVGLRTLPAVQRVHRADDQPCGARADLHPRGTGADTQKV